VPHESHIVFLEISDGQEITHLRFGTLLNRPQSILIERIIIKRVFEVVSRPIAPLVRNGWLPLDVRILTLYRYLIILKSPIWRVMWPVLVD
jgi:hypothetical protein